MVRVIQELVFTEDTSALERVNRRLTEIENRSTGLRGLIRSAFGGRATGRFQRDIQGATQETTRLRGALNTADKATKKLGKSFSLVGDFVKGNLIAGAITSVTSSIGGLVSRMGELAVTSEQTQVAFETFLGSPEKAIEVLEDLNKFSLETPFTPDQVNEAGKSLLAFGTEQEKLIPTLRTIGDLSAGTGKNFGELATLVGKARVENIIYNETLNQFTEAGIPLLDELTKKFQVSAVEIKKLASEGKISFADLEEGLTNLTSEGGKFFELTAKQSQTVGGLLSTAKGAFDSILKSIGEAFLPLLRQILPPIINGLFAISEAAKPIVNVFSEGLGRSFQFLGKAASPVITAFNRFREAIGGVFEKIEDVLPAGNALAGVFTFLSNAATTFFNVFSRVLEFEAVQKAIGGLVGALARIPAFFNGVLEAGKQLVDNLGNRFVVLGLQAEKLGLQVKSIFSDDAADSAKQIERRIEQIRGQRKALLDAFNDGFKEVANAELPPAEVEIKPTVPPREFQKAGDKAGAEFALGMSKKVKKDIEKLTKDIVKQFEQLGDDLESLELDTLSGEERLEKEREIALAQLKLSAETTLKQIQELEKIDKAKADQLRKQFDDEQVFQKLTLQINEKFNREIQDLRNEEFANEIKLNEEKKKLSEDEKKRKLADAIAVLDQQKEIELAKIDLLQESTSEVLTLEQDKERQRLVIIKAALEKRIEFIKRVNGESAETELLDLQLDKLQQQIDKIDSIDISGLEKFKKKFLEALNIDDKELKAIGGALNEAFTGITDGLQANVDVQLEQNQRLIDGINGRISEIEEALEGEREKQRNGFANNTAALEQQLETEVQAREDAEKKRQAIERKAAKIRLAQEGAQLASSVALSIANVFANESKKGIVGVALAIASAATIFASIKKFQAQAKQLKQAPEFGDGGEIEGKSHKEGGVHIIAEGKEIMVNKEDAQEHKDFLLTLNDGKYKGKNLKEIIESERTDRGIEDKETREREVREVLKRSKHNIVVDKEERERMERFLGIRISPSVDNPDIEVSPTVDPLINISDININPSIDPKVNNPDVDIESNVTSSEHEIKAKVTDPTIKANVDNPTIEIETSSDTARVTIDPNVVESDVTIDPSVETPKVSINPKVEDPHVKIPNVEVSDISIDPKVKSEEAVTPSIEIKPVVEVPEVSIPEQPTAKPQGVKIDGSVNIPPIDIPEPKVISLSVPDFKFPELPKPVDYISNILPQIKQANETIHETRIIDRERITEKAFNKALENHLAKHGEKLDKIANVIKGQKIITPAKTHFQEWIDEGGTKHRKKVVFSD